MAAITKPTSTTQIPSLRGLFMQAVQYLFSWFKRRWTHFNNRRAILHLRELDTHLLRDIGLYRQDIYTAMHTSKHNDPTQALGALVDANKRIDAARTIC